jgi:hypothetical protein
VDFRKDRRIVFTGSFMPLAGVGQESGVGRWHTIRLTTLSFYEYLQIKSLFARYYDQNVRFTYWRGKKDREVDLVAEIGGQIIPFEVKYRAQHTGPRDLKGLLEFCQQKAIDRGYVVTKSPDDFGMVADLTDTATRILRIPAPLLCYWMGESELTPEQQ